MNSVSAIIFDLGNVIIDLSPEQAETAFRRLGAQQSFSTLFKIGSQLPVYTRYEIGEMQDEEFRQAVKQLLQFESTDDEFDSAYTALLVDVDPERLKILADLRQHYQLFLYSNTNSIHMRTFKKRVEQKLGIPGFADYFEQIYFSHEMNTRKPEPAGFLKILSDHNLDPVKTLFVDDVLENVEGANKVGIKGFHYKTGSTLQDVVNYLKR